MTLNLEDRVLDALAGLSLIEAPTAFQVADNLAVDTDVLEGERIVRRTLVRLSLDGRVVYDLGDGMRWRIKG